MISRIKTEKEKEREEKKKQLIIGGALIFIMVVSTAGFAILSSTPNSKDLNSLTEKGIKFIRQGGVWTFQHNGLQIVVQNLPSQIEDVRINASPKISDYVNQPIYLVNPDSQSSGILINFLSPYILRFQEACISENCSKNLPVKDCSSNLFIFNPEKKTSVEEEGKCIKINGNPSKAVDSFIYKTLGII